jgi:hypothetical protein
MKKIKSIKVVGFCLLLIILCLSEAISNSRLNTPEMIYFTDKELNMKFHYVRYTIIKDALYISISLNIRGSEYIRRVFKYEDKQLKELKISKRDWDEKYWHNAIDASKEIVDNKIQISNDKYLELISIYDDPGFVNFILLNNGKKRYASKKYLCLIREEGDNNTDTYLDRPNGKIYFGGYYNRQTCGIYVYDTNKNKFSDIRVESTDKPDRRKMFKDPIRIPNTQYLLYHTDNIIDNEGNLKRGIEFWIQEIPEWKSEIEALKKSN